MKKYWALLIASVIVFAYQYEYALGLLRLPRGTIIFNDFALLTYQCQAARSFFAASGTLWGYDPHFAAGMPLTFLWNSNVLLQSLSVLLKGYEAQDVIKMVLYCSLMLFPVFFYWTLRNFGFTRAHSWAGALLGLLVFRLDVPMLFHITGMVTAGIITWYSLFLFSLLFRFVKHQDARSALLLLVFSPPALLIHKTIVIILFVPALVLMAQRMRALRWTSWLTLLGAAGLTLALNWFWLKPAFLFMKYKTFLEEAPFWQNRDAFLPLKDYFTFTARTNNVEWTGWYGAAHMAMLWVLLAAGAAGLMRWRRQGRMDLLVPIGLSAAFLFVFSYYGAFLRIFAEANPTRYLPVMNLLLVMPATAALVSVYHRMNRLSANALFLCGALGACVLSFYHIARFDSLLALRLDTSQTREVTDLVLALRDLPPGGRVLLEDSGVMDREGQGQVYALSHIPSQFPELTGKSFIGGPYPYLFVKHHQVDFHDGKFLGRELEDVPFEQFKKYADLYDITWVVSWSGRARGYFDAYPDYFRPMRDIGRFRVYQAARAPGPFLKGRGRVEATYNRIALYDIEPVHGEIILKYHWLDTLRCEPQCRVERAGFMDDPAGFIRIQNPPRMLTIVNP